MDSKNKKTVVAAATLAGMALSFAALFHAGDYLGEATYGPSEVARAPDGTVWVASHGALHRFTEAGGRKQVLSLGALGLGPIISELLALSDGTLILAQAVPSAAYRCNPGTQKCVAITAGLGRVGPTEYALMVAADEQRGRWYFSDNAKHRLILTDAEGKVLDVSAPRRVMHPNELVVEKPGQLMVVDTDHRRLARIPVEGDVFGADLWEMKTDSSLSRPGRYLPMDLAQSPDGGWWVLIAREGMRDADLVLFGADGKALKRVDLGPDSDPTRIASIPGGLLVADPTRATLTRVSADGAAVAPWGDAAFQADLDGLRASRSLWGEVRLAAQVLVVVFPLLGIWALWRLGERLPVPAQAPVPATPLPVSGAIRWLEVLPAFKKRARILLITVLIVFGGTSIALLYFFASFPQSLPRAAQFFFVAIFALMVLMPVILLVRPPRAWRTRLGTDGKRFLLDLGDGKVRGYPFESLVVNGRQVLAGHRLIQLRAGYDQRPLFDEKELAGYVLSRIPPANRVSSFQLLMRALRAGNRETRWSIGLVVAVLALFALSELFPEVAAGLKKAALDFLSADPAR
ncbi:MAG TPA: hypothetical protein VFK92_08385 [Burkholderiales bacterium]|nr:hypothetical protein [Burkholderiales bacterium]